MTTPQSPPVDVEAEANRQLHRRIAAWFGWPLTVLVAFAVGYAVVGQHTAAVATPPPPAVSTVVQPAPAQSPTVSPAPKVGPATTGVGNPAPPHHGKTKVIQPTDGTATAVTSAPEPPAASATPATTPPAPVTTSPGPTSPPPLLTLCLRKICL